MVEKHQDPNHPARIRVVGALSLVEDVVYTGLGVLLSIAAIVLLVRGFKSFYLIVAGRASSSPFVELLDQVLLVLLVVELLYTVQVSFRERGICASDADDRSPRWFPDHAATACAPGGRRRLASALFPHKRE